VGISKTTGGSSVAFAPPRLQASSNSSDNDINRSFLIRFIFVSSPCVYQKSPFRQPGKSGALDDYEMNLL
jgi:hypothetical protein